MIYTGFYIYCAKSRVHQVLGIFGNINRNPKS
ncbi:hypothetical protein FHW68_004458 [Pseudomonas sp. Tn43]|nr:hypothetical protein [Pseudomonas sp. Tn43]